MYVCVSISGICYSNRWCNIAFTACIIIVVFYYIFISKDSIKQTYFRSSEL